MPLTAIEVEALSFCRDEPHDEWSMPPNIEAAACMLYRAGMMARTALVTGTWTYRITDAGRVALAEHQRGELSRQKAIAAIKAGRVEMDPGAAEAIGRMDLRDPDFTLTATELTACWGPSDRNGGGFEVRWETQSAGAGRITVYRDTEGRLRCDNEGMGPVFLTAVFAHLIGQMELADS